MNKWIELQTKIHNILKISHTCTHQEWVDKYQPELDRLLLKRDPMIRALKKRVRGTGLAWHDAISAIR